MSVGVGQWVFEGLYPGIGATDAPLGALLYADLKITDTDFFRIVFQPRGHARASATGAERRYYCKVGWFRGRHYAGEREANSAFDATSGSWNDAYGSTMGITCSRANAANAYREFNRPANVTHVRLPAYFINTVATGFTYQQYNGAALISSNLYGNPGNTPEGIHMFPWEELDPACTKVRFVAQGTSSIYLGVLWADINSPVDGDTANSLMLDGVEGCATDIYNGFIQVATHSAQVNEFILYHNSNRQGGASHGSIVHTADSNVGTLQLRTQEGTSNIVVNTSLTPGVKIKADTAYLEHLNYSLLNREEIGISSIDYILYRTAAISTSHFFSRHRVEQSHLITPPLNLNIDATLTFSLSCHAPDRGNCRYLFEGEDIWRFWQNTADLDAANPWCRGVWQHDLLSSTLMSIYDTCPYKQNSTVSFGIKVQKGSFLDNDIYGYYRHGAGTETILANTTLKFGQVNDIYDYIYFAQRFGANRSFIL